MRRLSAISLLALSSSLLAVAMADHTVIADPSSSGIRSAQRTNRMVFVGGVRGLSELAEPSIAERLIATGRIGLYEHANGMAALATSERSKLLAVWRATGGGHGLGEVGAYTTPQPSYRAYFGSAGVYPIEINMNALTGNGDGTGTYATSKASGDKTTGATYTGFVQASDLTKVEAAIGVARAAGARSIAVFFSPNGGGEDIVDPFDSGGFWANVRTIIADGGGLALDTPPAYFLARGPRYQFMIEQMIKWAEGKDYRVCLVVSPYATAADAAGNTAGNGYDPRFLAETRQEINILRGQGALPTSYGVENYGLNGTENLPVDISGNGLIDVAKFLADTSPATPLTDQKGRRP